MPQPLGREGALLFVGDLNPDYDADLPLEIDMCSSLERAFELLGSGKPYQAVFCDSSMSDPNGGNEFSQFVCTQFPELPLVIVTEPGEVTVGIIGMLLGASDHVQKPLRGSDVMSSLIRAHLRKQIERNLMRGPEGSHPA